MIAHNAKTVNFMKDIVDLFKKHGIDVEFFMPEIGEQRDYLFEVMGQNETEKAMHVNRTYIRIYEIPQ